MIKLNASVAKKVPAEQEYSSKSYMASIEVELPSNLTPEELKLEIHKTYAGLEVAIQEQIDGKGEVSPKSHTHSTQRRKPRGNAPAAKASNKQIAYLLDLGKASGKTLGVLNAEAEQRFGVQSIYELTRKDCSHYLDDLKAAA
jgi:hypothetical protein